MGTYICIYIYISESDTRLYINSCARTRNAVFPSSPPPYMMQAAHSFGGGGRGAGGKKGCVEEREKGGK